MIEMIEPDRDAPLQLIKAKALELLGSNESVPNNGELNQYMTLEEGETVVFGRVRITTDLISRVADGGAVEASSFPQYDTYNLNSKP